MGKSHVYWPAPDGGDGTAGIGNSAAEATPFSEEKNKLGYDLGRKEGSGAKSPAESGMKSNAYVPPEASKVHLGEINCCIFLLLPKLAKRNAIANVRPVLTGHSPLNPNLLTSTRDESTDTNFKSQPLWEGIKPCTMDRGDERFY